MLERIAEGAAEAIEDDLADGEESGAEEDVAEGPAVLEGADDEEELGDDVDDDADEVKDVGDDPERGGLLVGEGGDALEGADGDEEAEAEEEQTAETHELSNSELIEAFGVSFGLQKNSREEEACARKSLATNPERERRAVLDELEADEAVHQQTPVRGGGQPRIDGCKPLKVTRLSGTQGFVCKSIGA